MRRNDFERLANFFDASLDLLCIRDLDGRLVQVSASWENCLGYRPEELEGVELISLVHPEDLAATRAQMARVDRRGEPADRFVNRYRHRDGSYRHLEWRARQIDGLIYGVGRDITERLAAELRQNALREALEAERGRLLRVQSVAKVGAWETDLATLEAIWSDETFKILEKDPAVDRPHHASFMAMVHPEDRRRVQRAFRRSRGTTRVFALHHRLLFADGRVKHVEERWRGSGDGDRAMGTCQDITERHEALIQGQARLEAALAATRAILDNSQDIICTINAEGRIVQVNGSGLEAWGYSEAQLLGKHFLSVVHPDDQPATQERAAQIMEGARSRGFTNRCLSREGVAIPTTWSAAWSAQHGMIFAVGRDIRDQLASEERLRQAEKMEALGRLTGGVAHDFNNLLTVIIGSTEAVAEGLADRAELRAHAELALEAADRGAELVARLLAFSRNQPLTPQPLDCNEVLESVRRMLARTFTADIEIVVEKGPEGLCCMADRTQLTTALLNLCLNARDAMPGGGTLTIAARASDDREPGSGADDAFAVLSVEDNGSGMSKATRDHATEPFFTTKTAGAGSGLGLSMVYGFVNQSGGSLQIDSELGTGTKISLSLPATRAAPRAATPRAEPSPLRTSARILVVEDDDLVRAQVERQLRALGHLVVAASDGAEALQLIAQHHGFDLMMTDVVMPRGINGRELAQAAREIAPGMRILLTSGHNEDALLRGNSDYGGDAFLPKPYRRSELDRRISDLLGAAPPRPRTSRHAHG